MATWNFISPGFPTSFTLARRWCKQHGSTLAEITNERIWNHTSTFLDEFNLRTRNLILNAEGRALPGWQWITGERSRDEGSYFSLRNDIRMHAHISEPSRDKANISIVGNSPYCVYGNCEYSFVGEHDRNSNCDIKGFNINSIRIDGICYVFHHNQFVTWFEAFYACEKNNGRLATFRNIKTEEGRIALQMQIGNTYWIGLHRYEWKWAVSGQLITYANWAMYDPYYNDSCVYVNVISQNWQSHKCTADDMYTFVCIRDVTICASNPCRYGATCVSSTLNYTCRCASGLTGSLCERTHRHECVSNSCENGTTCQDSVNNVTCLCLPGFTGLRCQTDINECDSNPCQNGGTCVVSINNHTCSCLAGFTGSKCQSTSNQTTEPREFSGMQILIIATVIIILFIIIITIIVIICNQKCKPRTSNNEGESKNYETLMKPASQLYEELRIRDGRENIETDGSHPPSHENAIHHPEVYYQNVGPGYTAASCSAVYVNLECAHPGMSIPA